MPNWCSNFVQISHEDPAKIGQLAEAAKKGQFCEFVIPVPAELREYDAPEREESRANDFRKKYGFPDWYSFCVSRWGTKWDIDPYGPVEVDEAGTHLAFGFDSAWAPPQGIYEALVDQGFTVDAMYYEPGMGFCGRWVNGNDDYYDYSTMTAKELAEVIDPDIDEQFCITENMAEWEADDEENLEIDLDGGLSAINEGHEDNKEKDNE